MSASEAWRSAPPELPPPVPRRDPSAVVAAFVAGLVAVVGVAAAAVVGGLLAVAAAAVVAGRLDDLPAADELADLWVDAHLEAGWGDPVIAPDDPLLAQRIVVVTATINERTSKDVVGRLLLLDRLSPGEPIDLYITTQGGWTDSAFAIIDTLSVLESPVNTWAIGGCYSAGAMILAAGTGERTAAPDALIMVHANLSPGQEPNGWEHLEAERVERFWRSHAHLPDSWFPMSRGDSSYYASAGQALTYGIVEAVAAPPGGSP